MGFGTVGVERRMRLSGLLDMPRSLPQGYSAIAIPEIGEGVREVLRACLKTTRGAAARDFDCGQGGEAGASPQRAVTAKPTQATGERPAARRVSAEKAVWLRCSSVEDPPGIFSFVAPRHPAFSAKTAPLVVFKQALRAQSLSGIKRERGVRRVARESGCPARLRVRGHIMGFGDVILAFLTDS